MDLDYPTWAIPAEAFTRKARRRWIIGWKRALTFDWRKR